MSAIAGIYYLDGRSVDRADLERMTNCLAHRGPDGGGLWCERSVGFGHQLLRTTPETVPEKPPFVSVTGELVITTDARVDNRNELLTALGSSQRRVADTTDSEVILAAYEKWGESCLEKIVGDFAFAIWDDRRQRLFCARDHFGVKPFYYHRSPRLFAFASEIKALLCLAEVPRQLNEVRVADYLVPMLEDKTITFYQHILRLPPACCMTVEGERAVQRQYWSLDPSCRLTLATDEDYTEAFRELFTEAVRCRVRSAFPVGSMLSGGLDSSSIACVAARLLVQNGNGPLHTFSAVYDEVMECDERAFIDTVLAQSGFEPHYVRGDQTRPLDDFDRIIWHQDEPFYGSNLAVHWGLHRAAHEHGVRVILDGFDGDTTVSHGFAYLAELARTGRWVSLASELHGVAKHFQYPYPKLLAAYLFRYGFLRTRSMRQAWRALRSGGRPAWWSENPTIDPDFARSIALDERFDMLRGSDLTRLRNTETADHYGHLTWGFIPFALEIIGRSAAAFSLDTRFPFFDKRLAEFCLSLPPEQKIRKGWTRLIMRRAMEGILPAEVQWRGGKADLSPNFVRGLLLFDGEQLKEMVLGNHGEIGKYLDETALRKTYYRYVARKKHEDGITLWKALTLALWLRRTGLRPENRGGTAVATAVQSAR